MRSTAVTMALAACAWSMPVQAGVADTDPAAATATLMRSIVDDRAALRVLLQEMPKGGDLHNHLGGAIYAEDLLQWAADGGLCVTTARISITLPPCDPATTVPAAQVIARYPLYSRTIDALSTRGFEQGIGDPTVTGADRFFATFGDFGLAYIGNVDKALALAREQAADDHLQYLELQVGAAALERMLPKDWAAGLSPEDFPGLMARLEPRLPAIVAAARGELDKIVAGADAAQRCGTPDAAAGCGVRVRYLMAAMRTYAPADVFAQLAYGYALVRADPRVVGVNIVAPEHEPVAVHDYRLHMAMFAFLNRRTPGVPLTLHAGELALGMVPPRDLRFHIRDAIQVAGARRIGHGVDLPYEADATGLLGRMARDRIAVEINLTSNAVILGVQGRTHPLALYRAAGVPVTLSTDDEGVSRTDMTNEYLRAVTEQGLDYPALKQIARDSLAYSFAPGEGLWRGAAGGARVAACAGPLDAASCEAFARANEKAWIQRTLEQAIDRFERVFVPRFRQTMTANTKTKNNG